MSDNDVNMHLKTYRLGYDHDRSGWCVYVQEYSVLSFVAGPYDHEREASDKMRELNKAQGFEV